MLPLFTQLLKDYLVRQNVAPDATGTTPPDRVTLGPPNRNFVVMLPQGQSVNIYLADVRENRKLGSNERQREPARNGHPTTIRESLYPAWIDAHYLITAWDTAADPNANALKVHEIIANLSAALLAGDPFTPREVYPDPTDAQLASVEVQRANARAAARAAGLPLDRVVAAGDRAADAERHRVTDRILAPLLAWPEDFRQPGLPYDVLPPEGFPKLSEFWTTMGTGSIWRPVVYLVAAVPIELKPRFEYPIVTTMRTTIGQTASAPGRQIIRAIDEDGFRTGTDREWYQIGGFVTRPVLDANGVPQVDPNGIPLTTVVPGIKLILESTDLNQQPAVFVRLQETRTDNQGKYQFVFAGPLATERIAFRIVAQPARIKGDTPGQSIHLNAQPIDVVLTPADPFPHDVVMQPV